MKHSILTLLLLIVFFLSCTDKNPRQETDPLIKSENYSFTLFFAPPISYHQDPLWDELILTDRRYNVLLDTILERDLYHTIKYQSPEEKINLTYIFGNNIETFYDFTPHDWAIPYTLRGISYPAKEPPQDEETQESTVRLTDVPSGQYNLQLTGGGYSSESSIDIVVNYDRRMSGEYLYYVSAELKQFLLAHLTTADTTISLNQLHDLTKIDYRFNVDYPLDIYAGVIAAYPDKDNMFKYLFVFESYDNLFDNNTIYCPISSEFQEYQTALTFIDENRNEYAYILLSDYVPDKFDLIDRSDIQISNTSFSEFSIDFNNIQLSYYSTKFINDSLCLIQYLPPERKSYCPDSLLSAIKNCQFLQGENLNDFSLSEVVVELSDSLNYQDFIGKINNINLYDSNLISLKKRLTIKY